MALLTTIANAQNIKGSHQVRANDEVKKQQVENRSENRPLIYHGDDPIDQYWIKRGYNY